jgi:MoaA/NifB/PqqE/SkfB family radical SAM enzyme
MSILNNLKSVFTFDTKSNGYSPIDQQTVKDFNQQRPGGKKEHVCYAPFNSMRFGLKGRVVACCHNSKEAYGEYPKQSIKQIWNSQQAKTLRNHICNDDLSFGCQVCQIDFESKNFNSVRTYMYDHFPVNAEYPTMMDFLLENTCNLECGMCNGVFSSAIRVNREGMPRKDEHYDERFVEELKEFIPHLTEARFTGGEPFLIKRYYEIWDLISSMNPTCNINVQTNGNVLTPRVKKTLEHGRFGINVSIESLEKDNYASIMKNGNLDSALSNIRWFRNYCKDKGTHMGITICPMRQNWHEIPDMVRFCNEEGALMWFSVVYSPSSHAIWAMTFDELQNIYNVLDKEELPTGNDLEVQNRRYFEGLLDSIAQWRDKAKERQSGPKGDRLSKDKLKEKLLDRYVLYLEKESQNPIQEDRQQKVNRFSEKISRVMLRLPEESLPADCWGFADEIFSDDLVMEVYESETEDRIYSDLKVLVS